MALKNRNPQWNVSGSDISENAIASAKKSSVLNEIDVSFSCLDALKQTLEQGSVDIIVSNPPYIPEVEKERMADHVINHEPSLALFVDNEEPLIFYEAIAKTAFSSLTNEGKIYFEIHENFGPQMTELLIKFGFSNVQIKKDLQGKERMIRGQKLNTK